MQSGPESPPLPPEIQELLESGHPALSPWELFWHWALAGPVWAGYLILLVAMIYYAVRNDPNWGFWLWIMLIAQPFGAVIYFLVRYLPSTQYEDWGIIRYCRKVRALPRLETAATQIGNPYQFVQWGDALRDIRRYDQAASAYACALEKEPDNLSALWGAARINFLQKNWTAARDQLTTILTQDGNFKFGDASLLYAKCLLELHDDDTAIEHLQMHVRRWRQPEALFLLGQQYAQRGETLLAREQLEGLISDQHAAPRAIARKSIFWVSRAQRLLHRLPRVSPPRS